MNHPAISECEKSELSTCARFQLSMLSTSVANRPFFAAAAAAAEKLN
jgi:hypothetical protein